VSQYNGVGVVICTLAFIVFGILNRPNAFSRSALFDFSPAVNALIFSGPFVLLGLLFLLQASVVTVDVAAGTVVRRYGVRPVLLTKRFELGKAKYIDIDVGRGIYVMYVVFEDGRRLVLSPGHSELGLEKVLELVDLVDLPIKPSERLLKSNPSWLGRVQREGKVIG